MENKHDTPHFQPPTDAIMQEEIAHSTQSLTTFLEHGGKGGKINREVQQRIGAIAAIVSQNPERVAFDNYRRAQGDAETTIHDPEKAYLIAHATKGEEQYLARHNKRPNLLQKLTRRKRHKAEQNRAIWAHEAEKLYTQHPTDATPSHIDTIRKYDSARVRKEYSKSLHATGPKARGDNQERHMPSKQEVISIAEYTRDDFFALLPQIEQAASYHDTGIVIDRNFTPNKWFYENHGNEKIPKGILVLMQRANYTAPWSSLPGEEPHQRMHSGVKLLFMQEGDILIHDDSSEYTSFDEGFTNIYDVSPIKATNALLAFDQGLAPYRNKQLS